MYRVQYLIFALVLVSVVDAGNNTIILLPIARPISWQDLGKLFQKQMPPGTARTIEDQEFYIQFKEYIKEKNITMAQYVKDKILGFGNDPQFPIFFIKKLKIDGKIVGIYTTGQKSYLKQYFSHPKKLKIRKGIHDSDYILLAKNNFPYDVNKSIAHWVIWSNRPFSFFVLDKMLQGVLLQSIEWKMFQNQQNLKSVPEISHKQLFLRPRLRISNDDL